MPANATVLPRPGWRHFARLVERTAAESDWAELPAGRDCYLAWGPPETPAEELVRVPGARWRAEEAIKLAKPAAGTADYEVRSFHGRYRHITVTRYVIGLPVG